MCSRNVTVIIVCTILLSWLITTSQKERFENISTSSTTPRTHTFTGKVVKTPEQRARGFMFRKKPLSKNEALLFDYPKEGQYRNISFWMKNTYIPLDLLFLNHHFRVVDLHSNMIPLSTESIFSNKEFRYALEIKGGEIEKRDIKVNDKIQMIKST